ncbi:MAG: replication initiator protein A [Deltaproteobacteria bacterium]
MANGNKINTPDPYFLEVAERCQQKVAADPVYQAAIKKTLAMADKNSQAFVRESVSEIKTELAKIPKQEQQSFSFLPTELTRLSPFFPMSKAEMGNRPFEKHTFENAWGTMEIQGERLAVFDESVLLAILKLATINKSFTFTTTFNEILFIMGTTAGKNTYAAVLSSLSRLTGTKIALTIKSKDGKKTGLVNTILSGAKFDKYNLKISINEYFGQMYLEGFVTSINLNFRAQLKGDITKAMYRFYEGQPINFEIHMDKLCSAINLDSSQPKFKIRQLINKSLKELLEHKFFEYGKINKKDHVVTKKAEMSLKRI